MENGGADGGTDEVVGADEVMSEVHLGCPPHFLGHYISRFTFSAPQTNFTHGIEDGCEYSNDYPSEGADGTWSALCLDDDGDIVPTRRTEPLMDYEIGIQHKITSSLPSVGLQVWKAAMLLSDFILHKSLTSSDFSDVVALELGGGTGMAGIILARVARAIFLTDCDDEVLDNCAVNVDMNSSLLKGSVGIKKLDWKNKWPPPITEIPDRSLYSWTSSEIVEAEGASLLLAADVIYSNELTDLFFATLDSIMSRGREKMLYLALEKRHQASGMGNKAGKEKDVIMVRASPPLDPVYLGSVIKDVESMYDYPPRNPCAIKPPDHYIEYMRLQGLLDVDLNDPGLAHLFK